VVVRQLPGRLAPSLPIDLIGPSSAEDLAEQYLYSMGCLGYLPVLQAPISPETLEVLHNVGGLLVRQTAVAQLAEETFDVKCVPVVSLLFNPLFIQLFSEFVPKPGNPGGRRGLRIGNHEAILLSSVKKECEPLAGKD